LYKLHLILKYLRKRRIAWWALAAVTLCTTMVLVVISVMSGWMQMFRTAYHGLEGDITISRVSVSGFPHYQEMLEKVRGLDGVRDGGAAMPVIKTYGLINVWGELQDGVQVEGVNLPLAQHIGNLVQGLQNQKPYLESRLPTLADAADKAAMQKAIDDFPSFDKPHGDDWYRAQMPNANTRKVNVANWPGIVLGYAIIGLKREKGGAIERPSFDLNSVWVHLTPLVPSSSGTPDLTNLPVQGFWLVDVSRTGVYQVDSKTAYVDFDLLQKLLQMDAQPYTQDGQQKFTSARANQIRINVKPGADLAAVAAKVKQVVDDIRNSYEGVETQLDPIRVETWEERQGSFLAAVEHEKVLLLFLFGIISLVAVFLIFCIFYMIVAEKTRDIGILKSIGASSGGVAMIFLGYGLVIGIIGGALGLMFGYLVIHNINAIHEWLGQQFHIVVWDPKTYLFDTIPNQISAENAIWIVSIAVVSSVLGATLPALRAARLQPVESLRWE